MIHHIGSRVNRSIASHSSHSRKSSADTKHESAAHGHHTTAGNSSSSSSSGGGGVSATVAATPSKPVHKVDTPYEKATFGMGCFWGCDSLFGATHGILRTRVGYAGGTYKNPVYRNLGDHTEVIDLDFDPTKITFAELLDMFWNNHEYGLTTRLKRQYCSMILIHSEEQRRIAERSLREEQIKRAPEVIITEIVAADTFYPAEDYHQKYRLQGHTDLVKSIGLTAKLLHSSHVAAKLNGYLVGVGGVQQFLKEADHLGLTQAQKDYVRKYVEKHEGGGLFC